MSDNRKALVECRYTLGRKRRNPMQKAYFLQPMAVLHVYKILCKKHIFCNPWLFFMFTKSYAKSIFFLQPMAVLHVYKILCKKHIFFATHGCSSCLQNLAQTLNL
jgi:hypothetical protein